MCVYSATEANYHDKLVSTKTMKLLTLCADARS